MKIGELNNKKILILGFGKEGEDTLDFIRQNFPKQQIGIADKRDNLLPKEGVVMHLGESYLSALNDFDVVIKSPGIPMKAINPYLRDNLFITSQAAIFLDNTKGQVIGITGTKGKSTTASLIYKMLLNQGIKTSLIGNIGEPALKYLADDSSDKVYVYELSSFQLATIKKSPQIAIILNLYKDHLDHHESMNEYREAKTRITEFQKENDILIFNEKDFAVKEMVQKSKAKKIPFNPDNDSLGTRKDITVPTEVLEIIADLFDISQNSIRKVIDEFDPLPHRLEYVGNYNGIYFYNDSAATIPEAAISAINKMGDDLDTIILGGMDKGFDFKNLSEKITESPVKKMILFPETGEIIEKNLLNRGINIFHVKSMKEAVSTAFQVTEKGKICLLAPAASSFNMFKSYKDRGDLFKKHIKNEKVRS